MIELFDQLQRPVLLKDAPKRIVSLVPSITETIFFLGEGSRVIAVTDFCTEPAGKLQNIKRIGGTRSLDIDSVINLKADLVIAAKEENEKDAIEKISLTCPVYVSDVKNLVDALAMIGDLGQLLGCQEKAEEQLSAISQRFSNIKNYSKYKTVLYVMWNNPVMVAGSGTFIDDMLSRCGLRNLGAGLGSRYPVSSIDVICKLNADLVILSSEPYRFNEKHRAKWSDLIPLSKVILADATYFSWYGCRLIRSADYFSEILTNPK